MDQKQERKRHVRRIEIISVLLLLVSFLFIVVCGMLKDKGYGDFWWPAVGLIGFLLCDLLSLFLIIKIYPEAASYEMEQKSKKYDTYSLFELKYMRLDNIIGNFKLHKFKEISGGYLRKKVFAFTKDSICYYVKCVSMLDLKETAAYEWDLIDKVNEKTKNVCFLLFVYKSNLEETDYEDLKELSKALILSETAAPTPYCHTSIIILVDSETNEGRFLDMNSKTGISVYAHGCRLIKKYFYS